MSSIHQEV